LVPQSMAALTRDGPWLVKSNKIWIAARGTSIVICQCGDRAAGLEEFDFGCGDPSLPTQERACLAHADHGCEDARDGLLQIVRGHVALSKTTTEDAHDVQTAPRFECGLAGLLDGAEQQVAERQRPIRAQRQALTEKSLLRRVQGERLPRLWVPQYVG